MIDNRDFQRDVWSLFTDSTFQFDAAQVQAKALLSSISDDPPSYDWQYSAHRLVRNLSLAEFELESIATNNGIGANLSSAARRFARIWESLAGLREFTSRDSALLNAAIGYELAGYQANAMAIAKQLGRSTKARSKLETMARFFLQRRFRQMLYWAQEYQREPIGEGREGLAFIENMGSALAAKGFAAAVRFFMLGNSADVERAITLFKQATQLYSSLGIVEDSNLVRSITSLLPAMRSRSTWTQLQGYAPNDGTWLRYIRLLSRGVSPRVMTATSISELWPSQITALEQGLLTSSSSQVVRMPTSAGKTRLAELAIVHTLVTKPGTKCVYIAPYRALVTELEHSFFNLFSDLGYKVSTITGTYESDEFQDLLFRQTDVLITTPEKLDLLFRSKPEYLADVALFILDEAQVIDAGSRGIKYELLVTRLKKNLTSARFLVLSAVMPQETLEDFAEWFNSSTTDDVLKSDWRPSIQRYALFGWQGDTGVLHYHEDAEIANIDQFVPGVIHHNHFQFVHPDTRHVQRPRFPERNNKSQIAAELAYKLAELGPVLIFTAQANNVGFIANAMLRRLELANFQGEQIPNKFTGSFKLRSTSLAEEWMGEHQVVSWLRSGIGVHYGDLPDTVKTAIESDFKENNLPVLIATNTLAQGVNLPIKTVIIHTPWRYDKSTESRERLPARDYWNIAGRAGRAGKETEGLLIHIRTSSMDENDFEDFLRQRNNVEPVEGALYKRLLDLINSRITEEGLKAELDAEILAMVVEEGEQIFAQDAMEEYIASSFVQIRANRHHKSAQQLTALLINAAKDIQLRIPDKELRAAYSSTGLSSLSCQVLYDHIVENEDKVGTLLLTATSEHFPDMLELVAPICLSLPEMQAQHELSGSSTDLLVQWMRGVSTDSLTREYGSYVDKAEDLGGFIDEVFRRLLPWSISGYLRIAQQYLGFDRSQLSQYASFLPSMVKFGLPNPVACWAMSVGIPSRRTATDFAIAFLRQSKTHTYEDFLQWLRQLNVDRLRYEFQLSSHVLAEVSRAIAGASVNPLLRGFRSLNEYLPRRATIQGIRFDNRNLVAADARTGQHVELMRDYDEAVDHNAIMVKLGGRVLGRLSRNMAQVLAPEMDAGARLSATIINIETGPVLRMQILIQQAD